MALKVDSLRGAALAVLGVALTVTSVPATQSAASSARTAIVNVRLFDGQRVVDKATVLFQPGSIVAVGPGTKVPDGTTVIDGSGRTLLPGLIDAHAHSYGDALERALAFGVTTELDMFSEVEFAAARRREQADGGAPGRADLFSAGTVATAPGGHGTEYGLKIPTLTTPAEAQAWVDARIAEGSDYIKIVKEDGSSFGFHTPTLDVPTIAALAAAAHARGKLAVIHIGTYQDAVDSLGAGVDGLVHLFAGQAPEEGFGRLARSKNAFVIPTLTVLESTTGVASGATVATSKSFSDLLTPGEKGNLQTAFPRRPGNKQDLSNAEMAVRQLAAAGVPILAGSDAPNPGTAHGVSLHREMELLVKAGLTPAQALAAATSAPADAFRIKDRGRIAPGLRADLLLVEGDPTRDILATRSIAGIWKNGVPFDRMAAMPPPPPEADAGDGLVSDFEQPSPEARFGSGWTLSTDAIRNGKSTAEMKVTPAGARSSSGYLEVTGRIDSGFRRPWAGVAFWPGKEPMAPVAVSRFKEIVFDARGDGGTYELRVFAESLGPFAVAQTFTAGPEWEEKVIPFSAFRGMEGKDLQGLIFCAGAGREAFRFGIDNVRFR